MLYCRRCDWMGMLNDDVVQALKCPDCGSLNVKRSPNPFDTKRLTKSWKKPHKRSKKIKNMGLGSIPLEDNMRIQKKAFSRMNTKKY